MRHLGSHGTGQKEVDERRGDAVVEPALDVEKAPDSRRHPLVLHDRGAQGGVGRGDDGSDGCGDPQSDPRDDAESHHRPQTDGQG